MPKYRRLTQEQRYTIESMISNGHHQKEIAQTIGVNASTVSRELRRDGMKKESYCYHRAQQHAQSQPWNGYQVDPQLLKEVEQKLRVEQWSPEQISARFARDCIGSISHETIYRHLYQDKKQGGDLYLHLRHCAKKYRKRGSSREKRGRIKDQVMIDERPDVVEERSRIGDWEMDTVIGRPGGSVIVTMVERKTRYTLMALASNKEASEVGAAIFTAMRAHRDRVLTTTYDNGKEFAQHQLIAELLEAEAYFAHPYHSWERGLNENTNGLIRQYFKKGSSFDDVTPEELQMVEDKLNSRPRKCLDFQTPNEIVLYYIILYFTRFILHLKARMMMDPWKHSSPSHVIQK